MGAFTKEFFFYEHVEIGTKRGVCCS